MPVVSHLVIGVIIIVFIICSILFIFAPKSLNYFDASEYPLLNTITYSLPIIKTDLSIIREPPPVRKSSKSCENISKKQSGNNPPWLPYPDYKHAAGDLKIYPLCIFDKLSNSRMKVCIATHKLLQTIPDIVSYSFVKLGAHSQLNKHNQWKDIANNTLQAILVLDAPYITSPEQCSIWVNGEVRELKPNKLILYDSSKEHSIYNKTRKDVYILIISIKRPKKIGGGISTREYTDEIVAFKKLIN